MVYVIYYKIFWVPLMGSLSFHEVFPWRVQYLNYQLVE